MKLEKGETFRSSEFHTNQSAEMFVELGVVLTRKI